jgi:hypothetical protein
LKSGAEKCIKCGAEAWREDSEKEHSMNLRKRLMILLPGAVLCAAVAMAQVPPTSVFQLDGKAPNSNLTCSYGQPCDYWNLLNGTGNNIAGGGVGAGSQSGHSSVRTFINGTSSTFSFQGGGSKDANLISQWTYAVTGSPNKDTINGAYAAAYTQGGDFQLIFGADRLSPNGDANIGIWFFQQAVTTNSTGGFTGAHLDHDIFVISAFTNGGGASGIAVYEWDHTCTSAVKNPAPGQCADSNLRVLATAAANNVCGTSPYCAITNAAATASSWEGPLASPLFFEGGVNLTAAFAAVGVTEFPCFSSFLVETRSSQSTSAVLKDFLVGGFPVCGLSISKNCGNAGVNTAGTAIDYPVNGTVTNTGIGTLYNVTVFDTIGSSKVSIAVTPSTLAAGQTGTWSDTSSSTSNSQTDTAYAQGAVSSGAALTVTSSNTAQAICTFNPKTSLSVNKTCGSAGLGGVTLTANGGSIGIAVNYSGQVCNNGAVQVTGVKLTDFASNSTTGTAVGPLAGYTLAPSGQPGNCASYSGSYIPSTIDLTVFAANSNVPGSGPGRYFFNDLVTISAATPAIPGSLTALEKQTDARCNATYGCAPASCPICQGAGECTP